MQLKRRYLTSADEEENWSLQGRKEVRWTNSTKVCIQEPIPAGSINPLSKMQLFEVVL